MGILVPASVLLPITCAIKRYRFIDGALKVILLYLIVAGLTNVIAVVLAFNNQNNLFLLHVYSAAEFTLISCYFFYLFKRPRIKKAILATIFLYIAYCLFNVAYVQHFSSFNTYTRSIQAVIISVYSLSFLYHGIGDFFEKEKSAAHYWVIIGLIVYFMSSLVQFSFSNFISTYVAKEIKFWLWNFHATMVLIMYILFSKAYVICEK